MTEFKIFFRSGIAASAVVFALAGASAVKAQQAADDAATEAQQSGLADIIVTAERRESKVQETPIAITALSGDALQRNQAVNIESFANSIPNVTFGKNTGSAKIFIRGVGLDAITPGADPRVAIYTDGIYQPRSQAAFTGLYDLERIEVLAGPQGTLYGRNATAGAINFISRDPGKEANGYASLTVGNYGQMRAEAAAGGPLSDSVGVRLAIQKSDREGYGKMIDTNLDVDDEDSIGLRGKIRFEPSSNFNATIIADYYKSHDHSTGLHVVDLAPGHVPTPTTFTFDPMDYVYASNPRDLAGTRPDSRLKSYGISLNANLDLSDFATLSSISGYRRFEQNAVYDADQTTFNGTPAPIRENSKSWSQELRLSGEVGFFNFLVGGYYFREDAFAGIEPTLRGRLLDVILGGNGSGAAYQTAIGAPLSPLAYYRGPGYGGDQTTKAWALFTQETINLTDNLGVDLGLRYSHERRLIDEYNEFDPVTQTTQLQQGLYSPIPAFTTFLSQDVTYTSLDPKVTVHYKPNQTTYLYATFSQGFKSGGFNAGFLSPPFRPEKLRSYEAGLKTDLFDRRFRANIAGFYYDYSNLQVNITEGIQLITRNAAKAALYGFEGQFTFLPVDDLRLNLNASYLHSEYKNYITPNPRLAGQGDPGVTLPATGQPAFDLSGNQLAYAPKYKLDAEIAYTIRSGAWEITPRGNVTYTSRTYFNQFEEAFVSQPAFTKFDVYLDIENKDWDMTLTAFVRNAGNKYYTTSGTVSSDFLGYQVVGAPGAPRTYGVTVIKRF